MIATVNVARLHILVAVPVARVFLCNIIVFRILLRTWGPLLLLGIKLYLNPMYVAHATCIKWQAVVAIRVVLCKKVTTLAINTFWARGPISNSSKVGTWNCQGLSTHDKGQRKKRRDTIEQMLSWLDVLVVTDTLILGLGRQVTKMGSCLQHYGLVLSRHL